MFAIVDIAGFQERVSKGSVLKVPTLSTKEGDKVNFDNVLLVAQSDTDITVGTPHVANASVEAKVLSHGRGDKIRVFKMKRRKRYRRTQGHRQGYTEIEILSISVNGKKAAAPKAEKTTAKATVKTEVKATKKPAAKKTTTKATATKKPAAKKTATKTITKKPAAKKPATKKAPAKKKES